MDRTYLMEDVADLIKNTYKLRAKIGLLMGVHPDTVKRWAISKHNDMVHPDVIKLLKKELNLKGRITKTEKIEDTYLINE